MSSLSTIDLTRSNGRYSTVLGHPLYIHERFCSPKERIFAIDRGTYLCPSSGARRDVARRKGAAVRRRVASRWWATGRGSRRRTPTSPSRPPGRNAPAYRRRLCLRRKKIIFPFYNTERAVSRAGSRIPTPSIMEYLARSADFSISSSLATDNMFDVRTESREER